MPDELSLAVSRGEQRSDDGALLLDGGSGEHHEDEGHDHDDQAHEHLPQRLVASDVLARIGDTGVAIGIHQIGYLRSGILQRGDKVVFGVGALREAHRAVEADGVGVGDGRVGQPVEALVGEKRRAEGQVVHDEVVVVLELHGVVGKGTDARNRVRHPVELDGVADREVVVRGVIAVDRNLGSGLRERTLGECGQVEVAAVDVDARRGGGPVVGWFKGNVAAEVLVERQPFAPCNGGLLVGQRIVHGEAGILDLVGFAHGVVDALDAARGNEESRNDGDAEREQDEDPEVLAQVSPELAGKAL